MKTILFFSFSLLLHLGLSAQTLQESIYQRASNLETIRYIPNKGNNSLHIRSSFSKDTIHQIPFTDQRILKITLVYTRFSVDKQFDQVALDKRRINHLIELNPQIANNQFIQWSLIEQTGCTSNATCLDFFHGFVIEYAPYPTKEMTLLEIDSINYKLQKFYKVINQNPNDLSISFTEIPCDYPQFSYTDDYLAKRLEKYYKCNQNYKARVFFTVQVSYLGRPTEVKVNGYQYECEDDLAYLLQKKLKWERGLVIGNKQYGLEVKGFVQFPLKSGSVQFLKYNFPEELISQHRIIRSYPKCLAYNADTSYHQTISKIEKTAVFKVLERNNWKPRAFVIDATASMYPYTADLLKWVKVSRNADPAKYVFFNDGNDKKTKEKWLGSTGGLYPVYTNDFNQVKKTLFESMKNGGGGDVKENNIEALLSLSSGSDTVVMIADNLSFPRDIVLLKEFNGVLRIILCGTDPGINTDYLNLSQNPNITIHTVNDDLINLPALSKGDKFKVDKKEYQLTNKGFRQLYQRK